VIELLQAMGLDDASSLAWGVLAGATVVALNISAWFVGESIFDLLRDRLLDRLSNRGASVDEVLDLDRCDICLVELTEDIQAITCDSHRYCGDCDDASNRCTACADERWRALIEEIA
jgi:hypothetical protein